MLWKNVKLIQVAKNFLVQIWEFLENITTNRPKQYVRDAIQTPLTVRKI